MGAISERGTREYQKPAPIGTKSKIQAEGEIFKRK